MSRDDGAGPAILDAAKGAVSEIARAAGGAAGGEQLALLPPGLDPDNSFHQGAIERVKRDGPGRPAGATNKNTKEIKAACLKLFGDPLYERFRWGAHTPESLARVLGCTKLEAFDRLDKIRSELARFFYPQLAPTDADGNVVPPFLQMVVGGAVQQPGPGARAPWEYMKEIEQNQALPVADPAVSHEPVSHEDDK